MTVQTGTGPNGIAYDSPAILIDGGTTVVWEWIGQGGTHTVTHADDLFGSDFLSGEGTVFEYTFTDPGVHKYYCLPHRTMGQKGAVVVE